MVKILEILRSRTFNQSILTITATITSGVLGLLFYTLVARTLGPSAFGLFAVATATLALIADIGDLGTDTGLIRFIGKYINEKDTQLKLLKLSIEIKFLVWIFVLILGWFIVPFLATNIFQKVQLIEPLHLALIGVGGALLLSFSSHGLQALQKFKVWSAILVSSNLTRFFVILILIMIGLNLKNALIVYISVPFVFFLISLIFLPNFINVKNEFSISKEFFKFNRWILFISVISAISSRIDIFLTTRLLDIEQVGLYSAANQLTSFMPQLGFAIATVVAPKLAQFRSKATALVYLKKLQLFMFIICFLGLLGIVVANFIIVYLYGSKFIGSFPPFVILYFSQLIFLLSLPTHQAIFYYFAKPQIFLPVVSLQFLLVTLSGFFLINWLGIIGAALAVLMGNIILLVFPAFWVIREFKK